MNRRITLALAASFLALVGIAGAQTTPQIQRVTSSPGGNCNTAAPPQFNIANGTYWACKNTGTNPVNRQQGTWTSVTPPSTIVKGDGVGGTLAATAADVAALGAVTATDCGTAAGACGSTAISSTLKIVVGNATLTTGSPSTAAITGMPAFTSTTSYRCMAQDTVTAATNISVLVAGYVSTTAVTFTGPNTNTDTFRYICIGN